MTDGQADPTGVRLGKYLIRAELGRGGMGVVYLVEDSALGREVALKILTSDRVNEKRRLRFLREARAAARVNHPNVIRVYDVGEAEGSSYIAMEYVEGRTLRALLKERAGAPLPIAEALRISRAIAEGLQSAHAAGVVHRDLKPNATSDDAPSPPAARELPTQQISTIASDEGVSRRAFVDFVGAETSRRPLLIVLEDLHWGDSHTMRFIDAALRAHGDKPLMVLALGRPEVHDRFPKLWATQDVHEIHLKELSRKAAEQLVLQVLGPAASAALVERLVDLADGQAFYLEELIRAAALRPSEALPATVVAMVQARLMELSAEERLLHGARRAVAEVSRGTEKTS